MVGPPAGLVPPVFSGTYFILLLCYPFAQSAVDCTPGQVAADSPNLELPALLQA